MVLTHKPEVILLGHGSRNPNWATTLEKGLKSIEKNLPTPAFLAHMELAEPSLQSVIEKRIKAGTSHFMVLPLFFASGKHLQVDIPEQINAILEHHPDCNITLKESLGDSNLFWDFIHQYINAVSDNN